jgi:hypothetical protein
MDTSILSTVENALKAKPRILILGQQFLGKDSESNPLFHAFSVKEGKTELYKWWLSANNDIGDRAKELIKISNTVLVNQEEIKSTAWQPWNAIFTSCIDPLTRKVFEIPKQRMVQQFFKAGYNKANNSDFLPLFRLYGSVERTDSDELPPSDKVSLRQQRRNVRSMLDSLFEIVGPNGHIFIDGWQPNEDWLEARELVGSISDFLPGQVFIFGVDSHAEIDDKYVGELIEDGVINLCPNSLIEMVNALVAQNRLNLDDTLLTDTQFYEVVTDFSPEIRHSKSKPSLKSVAIPRLEWRKFNERMKILDVLEPSEPLPISKEQRQEAFHKFMAYGAGAYWKWLKKFAFERPVFEVLKKRAFRRCQESTPQDSLIILYGQGGSGKSVLLNLLALELRSCGLPVIFVNNSILERFLSNIDTFCQYVEGVTSVPVFIIYDGTLEDQEYVKISKFLASRGRKCVVIGSSYPSQDTRSNKKKTKKSNSHIATVTVKVKLDEKEQSDLLSHLQNFLPENVTQLATKLPTSDLNNFFAVLYRLMPIARKKLADGILDEGVYAASRMQEAIEEAIKSDNFARQGATLMEQVLRNALKDLDAKLFPSSQQTVTTRSGITYEINDAHSLINAVMLVSHFGQPKLKLPQSFALRLIRNSLAVYRGTLQGDIILEEQENNVVFLSARHELEAKIWIKERLHDWQTQLELIKKIVLLANSSEIHDDYSPELEFIVKLLQAVGPQGNDKTRIPSWFYYDIAEIVKELRSRFTEVHPRLLLIQSHTLREWVRQQSHRDKNTSVEEEKNQQIVKWHQALENAEEGLNTAIYYDNGYDNGQVQAYSDATKAMPKSAREHRARLETELACVLGVRQSLPKLTPDRLNNLYQNARSAWRNALRYDEENVNAVDTACWICRDRYRIGGMNLEGEAELLEDWKEAIDRYSQLVLTPYQQDKRDTREIEEFSKTLKKALGPDKKRFEQVASRGAKRGSYAAHTWKARYIEENEGVRVARSYIEENCAADQYLMKENHSLISEEEREGKRAVLLLYIRYWWQTETDYKGYFDEERMCLPLSSEKWEQLKRLMDNRLRLEGESENGTTLFLKACALMHLNQIEAATKIFDQLDRLNIGGYRRLRSLVLLCDTEGKPREFASEFRGMRRGNRYYGWCDELRANVAFIPKEYHFTEMKPGMLISPFHLSMSFRGLFAISLLKKGENNNG